MEYSAMDHDVPDRDLDELVGEIVETVAATGDADPMDLPPLYDAIDPDALTALLCSSSGGVTVEFAYVDYRVVLRHSDGRVTVAVDEPGDDPAS